jgi:hypothetical protein
MRLRDNYVPSIGIWDELIGIIRSDSYFCGRGGKLHRVNNGTDALYDRPLTSVEVVFSDIGLACGIWHDNTVSISNRNGLSYERYLFYIDVGSINSDIIVAVKDNIVFCRELLASISDNLNLSYNGNILPDIEILPVEQLSYNDNQIMFVSSIKMNIEANTIYR